MNCDLIKKIIILLLQKLIFLLLYDLLTVANILLVYLMYSVLSIDLDTS